MLHTIFTLFLRMKLQDTISITITIRYHIHIHEIINKKYSIKYLKLCYKKVYIINEFQYRINRYSATRR